MILRHTSGSESNGSINSFSDEEDSDLNNYGESFLTQNDPDRESRDEDRPLRAPWQEVVSLNDPTGPSSRVSVLLLEKLGEKLPLNEDLDDTTYVESLLYPHLSFTKHVHFRHDVNQVGGSLAPFHVDVEDVRWSNILKASDSPGAFPSLRSPHTGMTHNWRVVDLESAFFMFGPSKRTALSWKLSVSRILESLPYGRVMEPWETE